MKTCILERTQFFPLPRARVFPFFESPENLGTITPSWLKFRILTPLPIEMKPGTIIEYTITLLGIPMHWRTLITEYQPPYQFADRQLKGPYALWEHTHSFREVEGGTEMTDTVRYALPLGIIGQIVHWLWVRRQVEAIFDHRAEILRQRFAPKEKNMYAELP